MVRQWIFNELKYGEKCILYIYIERVYLCIKTYKNTWFSMIIAWNASAHWAATYCGMNPSFCVFHSLGGRAPVANQPRNPANHMGSTICQWIQIDALHKNQLYSWVVGRIWNVWNCLLPLQKWNHPFLGSGRKQLPTSGASEAVWKLYQFSENLTFSRISQHDASFDLGVRLERITKSPEPGQHQIAVSLKCVKLGPSHIWPLPSSFLLLFGIPTIRDLGHQKSARVIEGHQDCQRCLPRRFSAGDLSSQRPVARLRGTAVSCEQGRAGAWLMSSSPWWLPDDVMCHGARAQPV